MKRILIGCLLFMSCFLLEAQTQCSEGTPQEMIAITERGRMLAEYDQAAWHSSDAIQAVKPEKGLMSGYVARKTEKGWLVAWGKFNESGDRYRIVYLSRRGPSGAYTTERQEPPTEDDGFYFHAAKAQETARAQFETEGHPQRPYNAAVLPAPDGKWFVYFVPAQTKDDVYPLGGDVRFLASPDGSRIEARRQMHKVVLDIPVSKNMAAGVHSHVLSATVEDTDVFHVLTRTPSVPEYISTSRDQLIVQENGNIICIVGKQKKKRK